MFKQPNASSTEAQMAMAGLVLSDEFQQTFNLNKGSIPVRTDMDMSAFDSCAVEAMDTFKSTAANGGLVPSMAHGMSTTSSVQGAIYDTVTEFFNSRSMTAEQAATQMARAIRAAQ